MASGAHRDSSGGGAGAGPCVFCDIIADRGPASVVYSGDTVVAFLDVAQNTVGHLLVVPRRHASGLAELDAATGRDMFAAAQRLAGALRASSVRCDAISLSLADGEAAGQEVPHVHLHVLPRTPGDGYRLQVISHPATRAELDETAADIRGRLAGVA